MFNGEICSTVKYVPCGNMFYGEIYSIGEYVPRGNMFHGEIYETHKYFNIYYKQTKLLVIFIFCM